MIQIERRLPGQFDWPLLIITLMIPLIGLIVLYSAGFDPDREAAISWLPFEIKSSHFIPQLKNLLLGLFAMLLAISIPPHVYFRYAYVIYGFAVMILAGLDAYGFIAKGARRWLNIGGFSFQPSELMKLAIILALARLISTSNIPINSYGYKDLWKPGLMIFVPAVLILYQPDLGTALCVVGIGAAMLLFVGIRIKILISLILLAVISILPAWHFVLNDYQKDRIFSFIDPNHDPGGKGYNIIQSVIAVGSGRFLGKGYLKGTQTQLEFLPEHNTDFIFSVLGEEWGFIGCLTILLMYLYLLLRILRTVTRSKDSFTSLVCFGVASFLCFHVIVNAGMVIGVFPVVGIPLPLFSYGGTSALVSLTAIGIVLGIGMRRLIFAR